jgi:hypothetical protein
MCRTNRLYNLVLLSRESTACAIQYFRREVNTLYVLVNRQKDGASSYVESALSTYP